MRSPRRSVAVASAFFRFRCPSPSRHARRAETGAAISAVSECFRSPRQLSSTDERFPRSKPRRLRPDATARPFPAIPCGRTVMKWQKAGNQPAERSNFRLRTGLHTVQTPCEPLSSNSRAAELASPGPARTSGPPDNAFSVNARRLCRPALPSPLLPRTNLHERTILRRTGAAGRPARSETSLPSVYAAPARTMFHASCPADVFPAD